MEKYDQVAIVGEGSYGIVMKCKHKETGQIVAIKKFLETEEDATVRKMALREIRMLKKLKHENLVTMIEVFRHRKRFYLVFEYLMGTLLDEMEKVGGALDEELCRQRIYQVIRAVHFCHTNNVIHRDIKPENVLVSARGVVKLCDFGFARLVSVNGEQCTEYVATRWYRAPELLVADQYYGASVDVWAIGCLYSEMMTGDPLFPGDSDIDQLYLIVKMLGKPCVRHQQLMSRNSQLRNIIKSASSDTQPIHKSFPNWDKLNLEFLMACLKMNPGERLSSDELMHHELFLHDDFPYRYLPWLRDQVLFELGENPLLDRLKRGIINSTDQADIKEVRLKKSFHSESAQWRINISEQQNYKRSSISDLNGIRNCSLFNSGTEPLVEEGSLYSMIKDKVQQETTNKSMTETPSSVSASKLNRSESKPIYVERGTTTSPLSTPPRFQSLQQTSPFQSHNVLHPNVHNICFCKDSTSKKSPNILQALQNTTLRSTLSQVPLVNPPKTQFLKRLERNVVLETIPSQNISNINLGPTWLSCVGNTNHRRIEKTKRDDFTLPSVPGAILTPNKNKQKAQICPLAPASQTITPDVRYKKAKRKYVFLDHVSHNKNEKG